MEITEQAIHLLAKMATEVQARFVDFSDLAHGWEHVHRVYHLALYLAEQEHAGGLIVGWQLCCMIWDAPPGVLRARMQNAPLSFRRNCWLPMTFPMRRSTRSSTRSWPIVIVMASSLRRWKRVCCMTRIAGQPGSEWGDALGHDREARALARDQDLPS